MAGAARGAAIPPAVRDSYDWLERLPPPVIAAPRSLPGQGYTDVVPNNHLDAALSKRETPDFDKVVASIRVGKRIRPVLFNAEAPILYCWSIDDDTHTAALCEAADGLYQLGRGVDMAWAEAAMMDAEAAAARLADHGGIVYRPSVGGGARRDLLCPGPDCGRAWQPASTACAAVFALVEPTASRSMFSCSRPNWRWSKSPMTPGRSGSFSKSGRAIRKPPSPAGG